MSLKRDARKLYKKRQDMLYNGVITREQADRLYTHRIHKLYEEIGEYICQDCNKWHKLGKNPDTCFTEGF
jgi:hypothetical protein